MPYFEGANLQTILDTTCCFQFPNIFLLSGILSLLPIFARFYLNCTVPNYNEFGLENLKRMGYDGAS